MPLESRRQHGPMRCAGLVDTLKHPSAKRTAINKWSSQAHALRAHAVQYSAPLALAPSVESLRVLELQQCFGLAVSSLLLKVSTRSLSSVMPYKRAGGEGNPLSGLL